MIYHYPHPEYFKDSAIQDYLHPGKEIILWGAGRIGGVAAHCLKKKGIAFTAFCDTSRDKQGSSFCGRKVISPDELKANHPDATVLISTTFYPKVREALEQMGMKRVYDCAALFMEIDFDEYDFWMNPEYAIRNVEQYLTACKFHAEKSIYIDQICLYITMKCTLRCRGCSAMIPYVADPQHVDADRILDDLSNALDVLGRTRIVNFYGGEPLLHPCLTGMVRALRDEKRFEKLTIITNGTLLPDSGLLRALQDEPRAHVRVSHYGALSKKADELVGHLLNMGISHEVTNYEYWDSPTRIGRENNACETGVRDRFMQCAASELMLLNGKAYLCAPAATLCEVGLFPESCTNYVNLRDNPNLNTELSGYVSRIHKGAYIDACRYCSGSHCTQFEDKVMVAEQTGELLAIGEL